MASVISSEVISDRPQANGFRYVRYKFVLEDNNLVQSEHITGSKLVEPSFDEQADMLIVGPQILVQKGEDEIRQYVDAVRDGNDPLHDWVGYWEKSSPAWNIWNDAMRGVFKWYLSREDHLELQYLADTASKISNSDIVDVLGVTNQNQSDIRADIQTAVNTQASLDGYGRWFDDDGNLVQ